VLAWVVAKALKVHDPRQEKAGLTYKTPILGGIRLLFRVFPEKILLLYQQKCHYHRTCSDSTAIAQ
jgi:hypothetical protein